METTVRRSMSPQRRLRIFETAKGICHLCNQPIVAGDAWDVEHKRALALGGEDTDGNCAPAHRRCHLDKGDTQRIAKAKRQKIAGLGIAKTVAKLKSAPFPQSPRQAKNAANPKLDFTSRRQLFVRPSEPINSVQGEKL